MGGTGVKNNPAMRQPACRPAPYHGIIGRRLAGLFTGMDSEKAARLVMISYAVSIVPFFVAAYALVGIEQMAWAMSAWGGAFIGSMLPILVYKAARAAHGSLKREAVAGAIPMMAAVLLHLHKSGGEEDVRDSVIYNELGIVMPEGSIGMLGHTMMRPGRAGGIFSGYVHQVVRKHGADGLYKVDVQPKDTRISLTPEGERAAAECWRNCTMEERRRYERAAGFTDGLTDDEIVAYFAPEVGRSTPLDHWHGRLVRTRAASAASLFKKGRVDLERGAVTAGMGRADFEELVAG